MCRSEFRRSTREVPEADGDKTVDSPFIRFDPLCRFAERIMLVSFKTDQHQWKDLQCAEGGAQRQYGNIGAMPPDTAYRLAADRLPYILPILYLLTGE
jgi:hypothetical protein